MNLLLQEVINLEHSPGIGRSLSYIRLLIAENQPAFTQHFIIPLNQEVICSSTPIFTSATSIYKFAVTPHLISSEQAILQLEASLTGRYGTEDPVNIFSDSLYASIPQIITLNRNEILMVGRVYHSTTIGLLIKLTHHWQQLIHGNTRTAQAREQFIKYMDTYGVETILFIRMRFIDGTLYTQQQ